MIIVDTGRVSSTDAFGLNLFRYNLESLKTTAGRFGFIEFTGNMAAEFQAAILNQHPLTGGISHACEELDEQARHYN